MTEVLVCTEDFDLGEEYQNLCAGLPGAGAVVTFVGRVRDLNEGNEVATLELQHYPGMTEKLIQEILEQAKQRWLVDRVRVIHRVGQLQPTDQIVFVGVASAHRKEAFAAAEFIMDYLKTKATFWKKESRRDQDDKGKNQSEWLEMKGSDIASAERWKN
jgi:molybdopterin synthase catalytic subunit